MPPSAALVLVPSTGQDLIERCITSALTGLSPATCRAYRARIDWWVRWSHGAPLDREHVHRHLTSLEIAHKSPQVRNQALAALKKLAQEGAELGWIPHNDAAQIERIKAKRIAGIRTGKWLSAAQCARLMGAVDRGTVIGKRDAAVLALLLGCGLRRAEAVSLETAQLQMREDRMLIVNLMGKGGRVRSVSVPRWAQRILEDWLKEIT